MFRRCKPCSPAPAALLEGERNLTWMASSRARPPSAARLAMLSANSSATSGTGPRTSWKATRCGQPKVAVSSVVAVSRPPCTGVHCSAIITSVLLEPAACRPWLGASGPGRGDHVEHDGGRGGDPNAERAERADPAAPASINHQLAGDGQVVAHCRDTTSRQQGRRRCANPGPCRPDYDHRGCAGCHPEQVPGTAWPAAGGPATEQATITRRAAWQRGCSWLAIGRPWW